MRDDRRQSSAGNAKQDQAVRIEQCRHLAATQRLMAEREPLPLVKQRLRLSAEKWDFLADAMALTPVAPEPSACGQAARSEQSESLIAAGNLTIDISAKLIEIDGARVPLAETEYTIMERLARSKGQLVSKEVLYDHLYDSMSFGDAGHRKPGMKIMDVFMCNLRKKLSKASSGEKYIQTTWGHGYTLVEPDRKPN